MDQLRRIENDAFSTDEAPRQTLPSSEEFASGGYGATAGSSSAGDLTTPYENYAE